MKRQLPSRNASQPHPVRTESTASPFLDGPPPEHFLSPLGTFIVSDVRPWEKTPLHGPTAGQRWTSRVQRSAPLPSLYAPLVARLGMVGARMNGWVG